MSTQNVNVARFARNVEWNFFCDFQTPWTPSNHFFSELCWKVEKWTKWDILGRISNIVIWAGNKFSFSYYYIFPAQFQSGNLTRWSVTHRNCKSILSQTSSSSSLECQELDIFLQDGNSKLHLVAKRENTCPSIWFMTNARAKHY